MLTATKSKLRQGAADVNWQYFRTLTDVKSTPWLTARVQRSRFCTRVFQKSQNLQQAANRLLTL